MTDPAPIGRLDHIGIAVHSIDKALPFFTQALGAKLRQTVERPDGGFRLAILDLHEFCIELLEPTNENGFLAKHLAQRGEGVHHITLQTPDLAHKAEALEAAGIRVVDKEFDDPGNIGAFISPRSAHGVLIQLGQTLGPLNNQPYWEREAAPESPTDAD